MFQSTKNVVNWLSSAEYKKDHGVAFHVKETILYNYLNEMSPIPTSEGLSREQILQWMGESVDQIAEEFLQVSDISVRVQQLREALDVLLHQHCPSLARECEEFGELQSQVNKFLAVTKKNSASATDNQLLLALRREYRAITSRARQVLALGVGPFTERIADKNVGGKRREDSIRTRIRNSKTPADYLQIFRDLGIPGEEWKNSRWLERTSALPPEQGGIGRKLATIPQYIRNVAGFPSFPAFVAWMEGKEKPEEPVTDRVRACATPQDFLQLIQSIGIPEGKWTDRTWLEDIAHLPPEEGGIERNFSAFVRAVPKDPRFGGYPKFVAWMHGKDAPDPSVTERVRQCRTPEDFRALFTELGIPGDKWRSTTWLCEHAKKLPEEGGIGRNLSAVSSAVTHDERFQRRYPLFVAWMDGKAEPEKSWTKKVQACTTREDFLQLFAQVGVPGERWKNGNWLGKEARKTPEEGGIGKNLVALEGAIRLDFRFKGYPKFVAWMDGKDVEESWGDRVAACVSREDFLHLFGELGIPEGRWKRGIWLVKQAPLPPEQGGIDLPLAALEAAVRSDARFLSYPRFVAWMEGEELSEDYVKKERQQYAQRIRACTTPQDFLAYFRELGIQGDEWKNSMYFQRVSTPLEQGGEGKNIAGVSHTIATDPRFQSFRKFVAWMEGKPDREPTNRERINTCKTPQDVLALFETIGVPKEAWRNSRWFIETAKLPKEQGGIGKQGFTTIPSILSERFGTYADFVAWMDGEESAEDPLVIRVLQCQTKENFLHLFSDLRIKHDQWKSGQWLIEGSALPPSEGGVGRNLTPISIGIKRDSRFVTQRKFVAWMEGKEELDNETLASEVWRCTAREEFSTLFYTLGMTGGRWRSIQWMTRTAAQPVEKGGIGRGVEGAILAIREKFGSHEKFVNWMDEREETQEPWRERIASLETPDEFLAFFEDLQIPDELWRNTQWLSKRAILSSDEGGIGIPLTGLTAAVSERFGSYPRFVLWMDGRTKQEMTMTARVLACTTRVDFLRLFTELGIPGEKWKDSTWRVKVSRLPPEQGGIGRNLASLAGTIAKHPQFESFAHFVAWMEGKESPPLSMAKQVANCITREDFLHWFSALGIPGDYWKNGPWLSNTAPLAPEAGGIGRSLSGVLNAIRQDERFGSFPQFVAWMEGKEKADESMPQRIRRCHTPQDFLALFEEIGVPLDSWRNTNWLRNIARLPAEEGGVGIDLTVLSSSINSDGRFPTYHDFIAWMDGFPPEGITSIEQALSLLRREAERLQTTVDALLDPPKTPAFVKQSIVLHKVLEFFRSHSSHD